MVSQYLEYIRYFCVHSVAVIFKSNKQQFKISLSTVINFKNIYNALRNAKKASYKLRNFAIHFFIFFYRLLSY